MSRERERAREREREREREKERERERERETERQRDRETERHRPRFFHWFPYQSTALRHTDKVYYNDHQCHKVSSLVQLAKPDKFTFALSVFA